MTAPHTDDNLDLWNRLTKDPSGAAFQSLLDELEALRRRLETGLRQPMPRQEHQTAEANLMAVRAALETVQIVHRTWASTQGGNTPAGHLR